MIVSVEVVLLVGLTDAVTSAFGVPAAPELLIGTVARVLAIVAVSYTHLTLPTNREV